jgi:hypothetical protein
MKTSRWIVGALMGFLVLACAPKDEGTDSGDTEAGIAETGITETGDTETGELACDLASLKGMIGRSADFTEDGIGDAAVWIFPGSLTTITPPESMFTNFSADFSERGTQVPYRVDGIIPRDTPYWVMAIFDDDGSGWQMGPGTGDLLAMDGGDLFEIILDSPGEHEMDFDLNMVH